MATGQYDNAWKTSGWTAQLGYFPDDPDGDDDADSIISPPTGMRYLDVTGSFKDQKGKPQWGHFNVTPSERIIGVPGASITLQNFSLTLRRGEFDDVVLLLPDYDVVSSPLEWEWRFKGRVGPTNIAFVIPSTVETDSVDVSEYIEY